MAGSEVINATPSLPDKLSLVTHHHLLTRMPVKLDLEDWNYGSWEKIESLVTTLTSLDYVVNGEDVVHYAITGLLEKYNQVCGYTHYQTTFPDLKTVHSLLVAEEMSLKTKEDFLTRRVLLRCDSTGDLYPVTAPSPIPHTFLVNQHTWHQRLGHPDSDVLRRLISNNVILCNKEKPLVLCHACQLGKHVRLPFDSSSNIVTSCFDIIHSDVWTSPIPSLSGFKYYVLFLDHYSYFVWVYPLIHKSDILSKFMLFRNYVRTQFKCEIHSFQCDHGGEFDNRTLHKLFADNGIQIHFSCPKTSQQNGKSERMVRTINNIIRTLLFQANLPPTFWVEALNMAIHLLNILPSTTIANDIPFTRISYREAFNDVNWQSVMRDEYNALIKNSIWTLVPRPLDVNVFRCMWLFRHKYLADGTLSRYKAQLVANGSTQLEGIDVDETFSLVVKPRTICMLISLATSRHWPIHQLDRSLYGLKQAPRAWFQRFAFILQGEEFVMTHLGSLNYFLGISVTRDSLGIFLSQKKYAAEILDRAGMVNCNSSRTPVDAESKQGTTRAAVFDPTLYRSLAEPHFSALKWILRYVCGTLDYGLQLFSSSTTDLVAYSDADWAGCLLLDIRLHVTVSFLAIIYSPGLLSVNRRFLVPVPRKNIVVLQMLLLRPVGYATYCHQHTKHIEIDIPFVHDLVATGQVRVLHVHPRCQFADIFTKGLPTALFEEFRSSLSVRCPLAQTAWEC
uniref:Ribonuclease H-like domain-containing protein n=1 Tax=Tanacetum cinerariifolium TaxID=118510 RepID=A0A699IEM0_TANCI|nr:ribonuclease H-like domain-containing protein [Tanacetum cinerariifolium]